MTLVDCATNLGTPDRDRAPEQTLLVSALSRDSGDLGCQDPLSGG